MPTEPEARSGGFGRADRLRLQSDFDAVRDSGTRFDTSLFAVQLRWRDPGPGLSPRRLGVIASRRVGDSVRRKRAKRLLREAWRWERGALPEGVDVVLVARHALPGSTIGEVRPKLAFALGKLARRRPPAAPAAPVFPVDG